MAGQTFILAHDTGTGGDKAVLTDPQGRVVHTHYRPYPLHYPQPGWVEQDPEALWEAVAETTRQVLRESGVDPAQVLGVGISAQMFNLLPVDGAGRPLMPMLSWLDARSTAQADRLLRGDLPQLIYRHTGNRPTAKDIIPKILWLKEARPDLWSRTAHLLDCKEYILQRLTGRIVTDYHGASVYFLFDSQRKAWSEPVCRALGIPLEMLPAAVPCTEVIGEVTEQAARLTGLRPGTPVVACAGDVAVAQTGAGANAPGRAHLCLGTATWIGVSSEAFTNDPQRPFWALNHIHPARWILAGEMETGGGALMWFRDALAPSGEPPARASDRTTYAALSRMAEAVPPGADRLLFAPWLSGERAPVLDHYARGAFVGLALGHTQAHLARAVMEGVGFHLRWILEAMQAIGLRVEQANAIGGGCTSAVWTQILSDVTGRRLDVVEHALEAGAIGAALTVAVGLGAIPSLDSIDDRIHIQRTVEPRSGPIARRYDGLYREYRAVFEALAPVFRRLHDVE